MALARRSLSSWRWLFRAPHARLDSKPKSSALFNLNFGVPVATVRRTRKRRNRYEVTSTRRFRKAPPSLGRPANSSLLLQDLVWTDH